MNPENLEGCLLIAIIWVAVLLVLLKILLPLA